MSSGRPSLVSLSLLALLGLGAAACKKAGDAPPPSTGSAATAGTTTTGSAAPAAMPAAPATGSGSAVAAGSAAPTAGADDPWTKSQQPAARDPLPHPLLWTAAKDGKTTYLFGTIHLGVDIERQMPDVGWKAFEAAPTFAMETDISDPGLQTAAIQRSDGKTIHDDLGDAYWAKLEQALTPTMAANINKMKVAVAATLVSIRGLPMTSPMDGILLSRAQRTKKQIVYLELAMKQEKLLDKWMDASALQQMLDDLPGGEAKSKEMLAAYLAGDAAALERLGDERADFKKQGKTDAEYDQMMSEMLFDRNASWIEPFEKLHAAGGGFVAVGAMHLIGKRSVLDLLAQRGFTITRVAP